MPKVLIVGYGNPLRGDDGVGQVVAGLLAEDFADSDTRVIGCHQLMPELAESLAEAELAVFIDVIAEGRPGAVAVNRLQAEPPPSSGLVHHVDPRALLAMAEKLYGRRPGAFLVSVVGQSFELGDGLSDLVAAAVPEIILQVRRLLTGCPKTSTNGC